jgi:hypothetical protein
MAQGLFCLETGGWAAIQAVSAGTAEGFAQSWHDAVTAGLSVLARAGRRYASGRVVELGRVAWRGVGTTSIVILPCSIRRSET